MVFNERFECKKCGAVYQEPEPRLFSFNNPYGACPRCQGFGNTIDFDLDRVIPDKSKIPRTKARSNPGPSRVTGNSRWICAVTRARKAFRSMCRSAISPPRSATPMHRRRQVRRLRRRERLLRLAGAQKIQAARARLPQPLSRLCHLPGLPRHAPARRSSRRENRGPLDHRSLPDDGEGSAALLSAICSSDRTEAAIAEKVLEEIATAPAFSRRSGPRLSDARPAHIHAFRRRSAAHPTGHVAGFASGGRAVRAR